MKGQVDGRSKLAQKEQCGIYWGWGWMLPTVFKNPRIAASHTVLRLLRMDQEKSRQALNRITCPALGEDVSMSPHMCNADLARRRLQKLPECP